MAKGPAEVGKERSGGLKREGPEGKILTTASFWFWKGNFEEVEALFSIPKAA